MAESEGASLVLRQLETGENTSRLVRDLAAKRGNWQETLEAIKNSPSVALRAIGSINSQKTGLALRTQADALETVLEAVGNDTQAAELLSGFISAERAGELIAARGDLPSSLHLIAPIHMVVHATRNVLKNAPDGGIPLIEASELFNKLETNEESDRTFSLDEGEGDEDDGDDAPTPDAATPLLATQPANDPQNSFEMHSTFVRSFTRDAVVAVHAFIRNLRERPDFEDLLDIQLVGGAPIRWYVALAVWVESCWPRSASEIDTASFAELGLEPLDMLHLVEQLSAGEYPRHHGISLEDYLARHHDANKGSSPSATEAARTKAKQKASNLL